MDGVSRVVGSALPIELQGKTYLLRPMVIDDIGTIEQYILANRPSPLKVAKENLDGLPLELQKHLLDRGFEAENAIPNYVTAAQFEAFIDSRPGIKYTFWLMLRREQPAMTFEGVSALVDALSDADLRRLRDFRDQVSAMDHLGNGIGASESPEPTAATADLAPPSGSTGA